MANNEPELTYKDHLEACCKRDKKLVVLPEAMREPLEKCLTPEQFEGFILGTSLVQVLNDIEPQNYEIATRWHLKYFKLKGIK